MKYYESRLQFLPSPPDPTAPVGLSTLLHKSKEEERSFVDQKPNKPKQQPPAPKPQAPQRNAASFQKRFRTMNCQGCQILLQYPEGTASSLLSLSLSQGLRSSAAPSVARPWPPSRPRLSDFITSCFCTSAPLLGPTPSHFLSLEGGSTPSRPPTRGREFHGVGAGRREREHPGPAPRRGCQGAGC